MTTNDAAPTERRFAKLHALVRLHLIWGWGGLFLFALLGIGLELLLAYKAPWLVDTEASGRRLLLRLAHAHGTLLGFLQVGFAWTLSYIRRATWQLRLSSGALSGAQLLIPGGFFLGAIDAREGDPGLLVALVPLGALLLVVGLGLLVKELSSFKTSGRSRL